MGKKTTFFQRFSAALNQDSSFMGGVGRLLTLAALNISCLLCLLPVVTGGGALTALYTLLPEAASLPFDRAVCRYFSLVRHHWKRTLLPFLLTALTAGALLGAWWLVLNQGLSNRFFVLLPLLLATAAAAFCLLWLFPVLAERETLHWCDAVAGAFLLGLKELPRSLALAAVEAGILLLALWCSGTMARFGLWLFFGLAPLCWVKRAIMGTAL